MQAAINAAGNLLPSDLPAPPIYAKVNPADAPILTLALTSKTICRHQVEDLADTRLAQKISQLPGVGLVSVSGGQRPAVRVQANVPRSSPPTASTSTICAPRSPTPTSTRPRAISTGRAAPTTINANDQIQKPPRPTTTVIVAYRNGAPGAPVRRRAA